MEPDAKVQSVAQPGGVTPRYWLEYQGHAFELWHGPVTIGRAADCNLVLDDGLVSRRHAVLTVREGTVVVEDLGSSNGVFVNGDRVSNPRVLESGDELKIGHQQMLIRGPVASPTPRHQARRRGLAETLHGADPLVLAQLPEGPTYVESSRGGEALALLAGVANKILALGRGEEAEKMLEPQLNKVLLAARLGEQLESVVAERAVELGIRLAAVTSHARWIDFAFELYSYLRRPLPAETIDQLYEVVRKVPNVSLASLREYVATLRAGQTQFGPAEKFLFQRIEGLERLIASK